MQNEIQAFHQQVNHARFRGQATGHYESFFLRANHPARPLAFWIRYTIFSPRACPENAVGELWVVFFDGETNRHVVAKQEYPLADCLFDTSAFSVRVGAATLGPRRLQGAVESRGQALAWDLGFEGDSAPILLLPFKLYRSGFPAAKSLVSLPLARFSGGLSVNGESIDVADWVGSQNHNWGSRHTDLYAWGQVAGFDSHPESFLELATARLRVGPLWTPPLTPLVLRHGQREYALTGLVRGLRARGSFRYFNWEFKSETAEVEIEGVISAPREAFVGLAYRNPPGGVKHCLNSKIAACTVHFRDKRSGRTEILETRSRAAFEILTSDVNHGVAISA
ncbi:MAG: hypothetical protein M0P95_14980 [Sulfuritalea sp.]|jgi:hypothetical protein|nr:hypothetical protein [Sulfuritalea sp.]